MAEPAAEVSHVGFRPPLYYECPASSGLWYAQEAME